MRKPLFLQRFGAQGGFQATKRGPRNATPSDISRLPEGLPAKVRPIFPAERGNGFGVFLVNMSGKALKTAPVGDGPGGAPGGCRKTRTFFWNRALAAVKVTFWVIKKGAVLRLGCCKNGVPEKVTHFCEEKGPEFGQSRKRYVLNGEPHFAEVLGPS